MHALRRLAVRGQVLVEGLGDERGEGRGELGDGHQTLVQGRMGGLLVPVVLTLPEAPAAAPDVPVGELVHESTYGPPRRRYVVGVEPLRHGPYGQLQFAEGPPVHQAPVFRLDVVFQWVEAVYAGVGHEERVGVPEDEKVLADGLVDLTHRKPPRVAGTRGRVERPAQGVGALFLEDVPGVYDVAERFTHLLALGVEDVPEDLAGSVRAPAEQHRRDREQRVEPPPRLVDGLADVIRRELPPEALLAACAVRVAPLGEGHAPRVEPHVENLGDAGGLLTGLGMPYAYPVYIWPVQVVGDGVYREFFQLILAADHDNVARGGAPDRQRCSPVALAAQGPIYVVLQPVAEAAPLYVLGDPVDAPVLPQEISQHRGRPPVPGLLGVVEQWRATAPAVRVGVFQRLRPEEEALVP